jgi:mannose-1-phosphate guanylyltransferase
MKGEREVGMADGRRIALILAGGIGERFWPLSRSWRPKQLLPLARGGRTLLQDAVDRLYPLIPPGDIYIVTGPALVEPIREADLGVPMGNVIAEPARRNTAGALVFAVAHLLAERGDEVLGATLAVLPADHLIDPAERFRSDLQQILEAVEALGGLAVIGIPPTRPETGYGYLERGDEEPRPGIHRVAAFREKPDGATAAKYLRSGRHFWNSGMFFWRTRDFLEELTLAAPDHQLVVAPLTEALRTGEEEAARDLFEALPEISIDYALMERARRVWMVTASFEWDDLGAWDSLRRAWQPDERGNITFGESVLVDADECVVVNDTGREGTSVAVIGVRGLTVVVSSDGVLVTRTDRAQDVRTAVKALRDRGLGGF